LIPKPVSIKLQLTKALNLCMERQIKTAGDKQSPETPMVAYQQTRYKNSSSTRSNFDKRHDGPEELNVPTADILLHCGK
jgi:hypothetical protein